MNSGHRILIIFLTMATLIACQKDLSNIQIGNQIWMSVDLMDSVRYSWSYDGNRYYGQQSIPYIEKMFPDWKVPTFDDWVELARFHGFDSTKMYTPNWPGGKAIKRDLQITSFDGIYDRLHNKMIHTNQKNYLSPSKFIDLNQVKYYRNFIFFPSYAPKGDKLYNAVTPVDTNYGYSIRLIKK